ncbi:hypothetical protein PRVXH_002485 [Proteinivorax hydrogeniformans]|uniref:Uncharacterized protein n=1 Tax=Proteinivorax hydrogeniformans TaxID=1826727 RepID=A0AAU8HSG6_9FIRM
MKNNKVLGYVLPIMVIFIVFVSLVFIPVFNSQTILAKTNFYPVIVSEPCEEIVPFGNPYAPDPIRGGKK